MLSQTQESQEAVARHSDQNTSLAGQYIFKLVSQCNLKCTYCYQEEIDQGRWRSAGGIMTLSTFRDCLRAACINSINANHQQVKVVLHGGEPLLAGKERITQILTECRVATDVIGIPIETSLQTNGVLLDNDWFELLLSHDCQLGISIDGRPEINDTVRVTRGGGPTSGLIAASVKSALAHGVPVTLLCVVDPSASGSDTYKYFRSLGARNIRFLLPAQNYESPLSGIHSGDFGVFLNEAFNEWLSDPDEVRVAEFDNALSALAGGPSSAWALSNRPSEWLVFLPDGSIEVGDCYGICEYQPLSLKDPREAIQKAKDSMFYKLHKAAQTPNCKECSDCVIQTVCNGGFAPFRYRRETGFDNPSIYCTDALIFYSHLSRKMKELITNALPATKKKGDA